MILFKDYKRSASRVFLAAIPVLCFADSMTQALNLALLVTAALWFTNCFFILCRAFFYERLFKLSYYFWLATLGQVIFNLIEVPPYWILSMLILQPREAFEKNGSWKGLQKSLYRGVFFICLMIYLSALGEIMTNRFLVWIFKMPSGAFLLMALVVFIWQNQPGLNDEAAKKEVSGGII